MTGDRVDLDQIEARAAELPTMLMFAPGTNRNADAVVVNLAATVPALVAEVRRLRTALETARELVNELDCWCDEHEPVCIGHQLRAVLAADETEQW